MCQTFMRIVPSLLNPYTVISGLELIFQETALSTTIIYFQSTTVIRPALLHQHGNRNKFVTKKRKETLYLMSYLFSRIQSQMSLNVHAIVFSHRFLRFIFHFKYQIHLTKLIHTKMKNKVLPIMSRIKYKYTTIRFNTSCQ